MDFDGLKYVVAGCGMFGAVIAERIAADLDEPVLVVDRRDHLGGNSYSEIDAATGIECHRYGSHIFHTKNETVWDYINRFCTFNSYRHKVLTTHQNRIYQMPINLWTINAFYGKKLSPAEARMLIESEIAKEGIACPRNLEEKAISQIGRPLYETFIKGYTVKQWGMDPRELPASIINRLPVRYDYNGEYFDDPWQGIPLQGYGNLFEKMLDHPKIEVRLKVDFFAIRDLLPPDCQVIFTGPIDRYFDYRHGELRWRTLRFEKEIIPAGDFQGTSVMNFAEATVPFTRIHEFRHYHGERPYPGDRTVIFREYSTGEQASADPCYPVNTARDEEILGLYLNEAQGQPRVLFGGRLGSYRYLDMDKAIAEALALYYQKIKR